ncbi:hypothetical protein ABTN55_19480, partial [Acinetobacter baumannii]
LIGELALIVDTVRPARAISIGRSRVLMIRRPTFKRVLTEYPDIAEILKRRLSDRLTCIAPDLDRIRARLDSAG